MIRGFIPVKLSGDGNVINCVSNVRQQDLFGATFISLLYVKKLKVIKSIGSQVKSNSE